MKTLAELNILDYFTYNNYVYQVKSFELDPANDSVLYVHCKTYMFLVSGEWILSEGGHRQRFNPYALVVPCTVMPVPLKGFWLANGKDGHAVFTTSESAREWLGGTDWLPTGLGLVSSEAYTIVNVKLK